MRYDDHTILGMCVLVTADHHISDMYLVQDMFTPDDFTHQTYKPPKHSGFRSGPRYTPSGPTPGRSLCLVPELNPDQILPRCLHTPHVPCCRNPFALWLIIMQINSLHFSCSGQHLSSFIQTTERILFDRCGDAITIDLTVHEESFEDPDLFVTSHFLLDH